MSKSQARLTYALLAVTVIIWGIQPLCIKWLVAVWTPVTITAMRYYLIGTALILIACSRGEGLLPPKSCWLPLLLMALTGIGLNNVMQFTGLQYSTVTNCTLIAAASPAITAFMAAIFIRERLGGYPGWVLPCLLPGHWQWSAEVSWRLSWALVSIMGICSSSPLRWPGLPIP